MDVAREVEPVYAEIFRLEPGETSEVFRAGLGVHLVRVLEREEGSKFTLEDAMPQIENYLFEKTKRAAAVALQPAYEINMNSGGLNRWREARMASMRF